jgi:hypothetical protein
MTDLFLGLPEGVIRLDADGSAAAEFPLRTGSRVTALAVDPEDPTAIYATTYEDGFFYSHDGGGTWDGGGAGLEGKLLTAAMVSGPDRNDGYGTIYVGTEPAALFKSIDGGSSFEELPSFTEIPSRPEWSYPPRPDTHHVWSLAADTVDPGRIYVGVELGGVMRSSDGGLTWTDHGQEADGDPHTLCTHSRAPGRVYEGGGSYFCQSFDQGETWERDLDGIPEEIRYFYSLAVDPGDPDTILISSARDPLEGHGQPPAPAPWSTIYRRTADRGWYEVTDGLPPKEGTRMGWLTTDERSEHLLFYVTTRGAVYRTEDGGDRWRGLDTQPPAGLGDDLHVRAAVAVTQ